MTRYSGCGSAPRITVYTKPGCVQCRATIRAFERADLHFATIDITADAQARDSVMSLGHICTLQ